jgi:ATP-dependent exoDNAse (exonuclease V) alpha subunit
VFGNCIVIQNLKTNKQLPITPLRQTISFAGSNVIYYRTQYPLMLAWALSVHKVQGMTLSRTYISLNKYFFERGQAYVALSRTKNLEDLFLLDYVKDSIFYSLAHKELLEELEERELLNIDENNNIL